MDAWVLVLTWLLFKASLWFHTSIIIAAKYTRLLPAPTMRSSSSSRDKRGREPSVPLPVPSRGGGQSLLPPLHDVRAPFPYDMAARLKDRQAIPEIRSTNPGSRSHSGYPRELHHDPPGPSRYPTTPSLGPSPPNSRSRFPPSGSSSSSQRSSNDHRQDYFDRSRVEMQLPMHSGPPSRNSGSPASSSYSENRNIVSSNAVRRVQTPERGPTLNSKSPERGSLPPIYTLTQSTTPAMPSHLPPINSSARTPMGNPYSQPLPPQPPHTDPRYSYGSYAPQAHDPHGHMGRPVEFQNVEVGEKSNKKRRGNLPKHTTDILRTWLHDHLDHAYPNEEQKQELIRETGLSKCPLQLPVLCPIACCWQPAVFAYISP